MKTWRLDFFIIYPHGGQHLDGILSILRHAAGLQILLIKKHLVGDWQQFITDVYACDHVSAEHLQGKTAFLKENNYQGGFVWFVLVKNKHPDEQIFGKGPFAHIQCRHIVNIKNTIRNQYNPRLADGSMSHQHVIHASDYESQVAHVLNLLGLPDMQYFTRQPHPLFSLPYHIQPFRNFEKKMISSHALYLRNGAEPVPLSQSIHYRFLQGDKQPYQDYIEATRGIGDLADHSSDSFQQMADTFDYCFSNTILVQRHEKNRYLVRDGNHRAAIFFSKHPNGEFIPAIIAENYTQKLHLDRFFNLLEQSGIPYCVLRRKEWLPGYYSGEDLDILTSDYFGMQEFILRFAAIYEDEELSINITPGNRFTHVDIYFKKEFHFRFDVVTDFLQHISYCNAAYHQTVLSRRTKIEREGVIFSVPHPVDDLIIRYLEFCRHPEKVQHLQYIKRYADKTFLEELKNNTDLYKNFIHEDNV